MENNENSKLLIAKAIDKLRISRTKNRITNSEFLNEYQIATIEKELLKNKEKKYFFWGGYKEAIRKVLIIYPQKMSEYEVLKDINTIISAIKIELPNNMNGELKHRDYLGMIMSFGLARERIGDIIVYEDKAYIMVMKENSEYIKNEIQQERKLKKAKIQIININEIEARPVEFEKLKISVNSLRIDNVISEILKTSRKIAQENIEQENIFINYELINKNTKIIKEKDLLVIRGNGKYIIDEFLGKTKNNKEIVMIKKYI